MTVKNNTSSYTKVEGIHLIDYEKKTTYASYSIKERFELIAQMFKHPSCENFWKRFKIIVLGYETLNSEITILNVRKIPPPASMSSALARMTYSDSELGPLKYESVGITRENMNRIRDPGLRIV